MVETKTQCAAGQTATALRTHDGIRATSTTASYDAPASSAGTSSSRSHTTNAAPSGTEPDVPRLAQVTSWPRATASVATALDRNTEPPSTRIFTSDTVSGIRSPGKR